jgi:hypothetical protein
MKTLLFKTTLVVGLISIGSALEATPVGGTYNGLFFETNGVWQQSAGTITLNVARNRYTGRIQIGNTRYPFSGTFDTTGGINRQILRRYDNPLYLQLQVDTTNPDVLVGSVGDDINWTAQLYADRAVFDGRFTTTSDMGRYTVVFMGDFASTNADIPPMGESFGTINITKAGRIRFSGSLADGTKVTQATTVSGGGQWPLYLPLYQSEGAFYAWLLFNGETNNDISGTATWMRPQMPWTWYYPDGFAVLQDAYGSRYTAPPKGTKVLDVSTARFEFNGMNLDRGITNHVMLDYRNRVTNLEANGLTSTFTLADGSFRGRVMDPVSWEWITFKGVVLQKFGVAAGYFSRGYQTGEVWFQGE